MNIDHDTAAEAYQRLPDEGPCGDLSILCVTRAETCVRRLIAQLARKAQSIDAEFVLVADGPEATKSIKYGPPFQVPDCFNLVECRSYGYIESVLDAAIAATSRPYILRIDDDESLSPGLITWLQSGAYRSAEHWKFNRANLYGDAHTFITTPPLWPDHQTRLSVRALAGNRHTIHAGSPYGGGELAPDSAVILHHKFLVKSRAERQAIADRYERLQPGAGRDFIVFSVPETLPEIKTAPLTWGGSVP